MKDSSVLILEAIVKLYNRLDGIVFDSKDNHFMDVTARNGRDVFLVQGRDVQRGGLR